MFHFTTGRYLNAAAAAPHTSCAPDCSHSRFLAHVATMFTVSGTATLRPKKYNTPQNGETNGLQSR
eukprot:642956-Amphidinium_carterae.1